jgi:hypothetical protein
VTDGGASFVACERRAGKQRRHAARRSSSTTPDLEVGRWLQSPTSGPPQPVRGPADGVRTVGRAERSFGVGVESLLACLLHSVKS